VRVLGFADHVGKYFSGLTSQAPLDTEKSFESSTRDAQASRSRAQNALRLFCAPHGTTWELS